MPPIKNNLHVLEAAFRQDLNPIVITDADWSNDGPRIVLCNEAFVKMTGYDTNELIGKNPRILQGPKTDKSTLSNLRTTLLTTGSFSGKTINYRKNLTQYHVKWNISAVYDDNGDVCNYISVQQDVTDLANAEKERNILLRALNISPDPIVITDASGIIVFINDGFENLFGFNRIDVIGLAMNSLPMKKQNDDILTSARGLDQINQGHLFSFSSKNGKLLHILLSTIRVPSVERDDFHIIHIGKNVTKLLEKQNELQERADRDRLTGLLNRHAGEAALSKAQHAAQISNRPFALLMCDIDHFKRINDNHGHLIGDGVLVQVARVLRGALREGDLCFRWGGEEFLILLSNAHVDNASGLADRLRQAIAAVAMPEVGQVTMSFGVGQAAPNESIPDLQTRVDKALYAAKARGRNQVVLADPAAQQ